MTEPTIGIVVVEDEANIRRFVKLALESEGFQVFEADSVKRGLIETGTRRPDLVVLDLGLPDGDGIDFIRDLRAWSEIPVLVLSARTTEIDKVAALDAGADDFVTKPFSMPELLARVRVALRHHRPPDEPDDPVLEVGDVRVDRARHSVTVGGEPVDLTPKEFDFLALLARNPGRVHTHRTILQAVWGPAYGTETQYLRVYASQLRKKLAGHPAPRLVTEPGVGYRLVDEADRLGA